MWRLQNNVDRILVGNALEYVSFDDKLSISILTGIIVSLLYTVIYNIFAVNKDCVVCNLSRRLLVSQETSVS